MPEPVDVAVVGAGPAGSSAAVAAVRAGARVVLLDRARFPRYKTCGGGLIGLSLAAFPAGFEPPVRERVDTVAFTHRGARPRERRSTEGVLALADREELDDALLRFAADVGAEVHQGVTVTSLVQDEDGVTLATSDGPVRARAVVGADGSASRVAREVGVRLRQVDLGLEDEVAAPPRHRWRGRVHLDWGDQPGSYGWVFPKGDVLTVGVIAAKGEPQRTREYLAAFKAQVGLADAAVLHSSGHLTRCRAPGSPLGRGRVLVAGDAAGLLEPWTREGISYATRSGTLAGRLAATAAPDTLVAAYASAVEAGLAAEMAAGERCLAALAARPGLVHRLVSGPGWRSFTRLARGETTLDRALRHRVVRVGLGLAGGRR